MFKTVSLWSLLLLGYMTLLYGLFKFIVCYLDVTLNYEQRMALFQRMPLLKRFITLDMTTAGKTLSLVYIVFAIITIIQAYERIRTGAVHNEVLGVIQSRLFLYLLYGLMGMFLLVMYMLVVYTDIDIKKDLTYEKRYKLLGICGGLIFLTCVPWFILLHKVLDHGLGYALRRFYVWTILTLVGSLVTGLLYFYFAYRVVGNDNDEEKEASISLHEILALLVIPTNII